MEKSTQQVVHYLQDAHATELGIAQMLKEFLDDPIEGDTARSLLSEYHASTCRHVQKLEQRLAQLDAELSSGTGFFSALLTKIDEMVESVNDIHDRTTHNLIKCYAAQHFEQGMYSCLSSYALACEDQESGNLAESCIADVEDAAVKFYPMMESSALRTEESRR